ncbi:pmpB [Symbiodinium sp. CCMP2592]|nr:pmpB [Symbiodinium sp. CCMP2592]
MELLKPNSHWRVSVERIDNRQGYVQGNCCLIAAEFNSFAQWSKQKVLEVARVRTQEVQLQRLQQDIAVAKMRPSLSRTITSCRHQGPDAEGRWPCACCGSWKHMSQFPKRSESRGGYQRQCKQCTSDKKSAWRRTTRGHGLVLLGNARCRASSAHTWTGDFMLDLDDVLDMLWLQGGRCYYSGVPLKCGAGPSNWVWSIERLHNSVTYNKKNCVLIAREFQAADNSRNKAKFPVFGTAQWSRSKVSHVWGPYYPEC